MDRLNILKTRRFASFYLKLMSKKMKSPKLSHTELPVYLMLMRCLCMIDLSHLAKIFPDMLQAFWETLYMIGISLGVALIIGLHSGVILFTMYRGLVLQNRSIHTSLRSILNIIRSIPFIILIVALIPLANFITGTAIGPTAASVSLSVAAIPFFARIVETSLREIDKGMIEAAIAVGATPWMIIKDVLLPEAKTSIIQG